MPPESKKILVQELEVRIQRVNTDDYICLTDIAKVGRSTPSDLLKAYLRNRSNIEFIGLWESLNNQNFNQVYFDQIRMDTGLNDYVLSVSEWIEKTNAVGITTKAGRYGGTFAHRDIAVQFASWLSPSFYLYLVREFQRLKEEENKHLQLDWNLKRQLAKANWHIHTEAVREYLVPIIDWNTKREAIYQASEADLLNLALFGTTAREWQQANPGLTGNLRDHASTEQLLVLANLQSLNAKLLEWDSPKEQRLEILNKTAREQMQILMNSRAVLEIGRLGSGQGNSSSNSRRKLKLKNA